MRKEAILLILFTLSGCASGFSQAELAAQKPRELCVTSDFFPGDQAIAAEVRRRGIKCYPIPQACRAYDEDVPGCIRLRTTTLQVETAKLQERDQQAAYAAAHPLPFSGFPGAYPGPGQTVYNASQCTGPIVAGICHGGIIPNPALQKTCHGEMLNGICTGPMF